MDSESIHSVNREAHSAAWRDAVSRLCALVEGRASALWWILFLLCLVLAGGLVYSLFRITDTGVGVLGVEQNVFWGWDIINFVFWIGIGHAGTLISAILLLTRQQWRSSVSRIAEVSTIFAVLCAAVFPVFHMGRVWMAWFFVPVPEANGMWPNFLSPLMWDAFAVGTYFLLSLLFLYVSMIPDLAMLRDRAGTGFRAKFYGFLAAGWLGTINQWSGFRRVSLILAGILTPLVISVHSVVSYDFAVTLVPGWHSSLFPPYFVAGAILGGLAMVLLIVIPMRGLFRLKDIVSINHLDSLAKLLLALSLIIGFSYGWEHFMSFYSGDFYEIAVMERRVSGEIAPAFWLAAACNVLIPQMFWFRRARRSLLVLVFVALCVTLGMWLERFVIIVGSMEQGLLPSSWADYLPSPVDVMMFVGTFGLFFGGILLFVRFFPCVGISELCELRGKSESTQEAPCLEITEERFESSPEFMVAFASTSEGEKASAILPFAVKEAEPDFPGPDSLSKGAFAGGLLGLALSLLLVVWTQLADYPMELQGREADVSRFIGFVPVIFETVILGAGLGVLVLFVRRCGLFQWWHPWFETGQYADYQRSFAFYLSRNRNPERAEEE